MAKGLKYKRVLLKVSGEGLGRGSGTGLNGQDVDAVAQEVKSVHETGAQVAMVVGGGNFIRGRQLIAEAPHIQEATAHYMGMLSTVLNAMALQDTLEGIGVPTRVQSALPVDRVCEKFIRRRCIRHMDKGRVVILAGGTGNPFVTTDTGAAQRALEINANALLKATQVDGVYSSDPQKDKSAKRYDHLTYDTVINERLAVMDISAVDLCQQHGLPIVVFRLKETGNMRRVVLGEAIGTVISA